MLLRDGEGRQAFIRTIGRRSNWQVDGLDIIMRSDILAAEVTLKLESERDKEALREP